MLQVNSSHRFEEMDAVMHRVVQKHGALLLAVSHLGQLLKDREQPASTDVVVFTICHHELSAGLIAADIRFSAFLPCRVAVWSKEGAVTLAAMSPREYTRLLNRPDLDRLVLPLETLLREIMEDAAKPAASTAYAAHQDQGGLGAREDQMSVRGMVPQRIDCKGSKVEDMAGTGSHDAAGG